jgi:pimeloyl-ACP methyl ester carboxylesterase
MEAGRRPREDGLRVIRPDFSPNPTPPSLPGQGSIMKHLSCIALAAALLGGCITYPVDEGWFFRPRDIGQKAVTPADMKITGEENLRAPGKFSQDFSRVFPNFAARIPAPVAHDFVDLTGMRIATTRVTGANAGANEPLIVACMGQSGDRINSGLIYTAKLLPWGEVMLVDYPGYGDSTGEPRLDAFSVFQTEFAAYVDGQAAGRPLIFWGHSLGGPVCSAMAGKSREVDAVVLEATVPTFNDLMDARKPWFTPPTFDLQLVDGLDAYDIPAALSGFSGPILVIGAGKDSVLPIEKQRVLSERLRAGGLAVTYIEIENSEHLNAALNTIFAGEAAPFFAGITDSRH